MVSSFICKCVMCEAKTNGRKISTVDHIAFKHNHCKSTTSSIINTRTDFRCCTLQGQCTDFRCCALQGQCTNFRRCTLQGRCTDFRRCTLQGQCTDFRRCTLPRQGIFAFTRSHFEIVYQAIVEDAIQFNTLCL